MMEGAASDSAPMVVATTTPAEEDEEIEEMEEEIEEEQGDDNGNVASAPSSTSSVASGSLAAAKSPRSSKSASEESAAAASGDASSSSAVEGTNIHFSAEGKKLCSYSGKLCKQRRMEGRAFCIKHILEDPTSGFRQCEYLCKKKGNRRCTNPVPPPHEDVVYCSHHRQILGLQPRTVAKRGQTKTKTKSELRSKEAHTALVGILAKHGIPEKSSKRPKVKSEEPPTPAEEEVSSDEFPSDEENGEEADVESGVEDVLSDQDRDHDNDGFIADSFLWHLEHHNLTTDNAEPLDAQKVMTEEEVMQMRKARVVKLLQLYKLQYFRLQDCLQSTYELYNKRMTIEKRKQNGSSDAKQKQSEKRQNAQEKRDKEQEEQLRALYVHSKEPMIKLEARGFCSVEECKARALEPSTFCFTHILQDPKQQLYITCTHVNAQGQHCSSPVLRTRQPQLCDAHMTPQSKKETNSKKKRKASQLLEEREKERARERLEQEKKQKEKKKRKSETTDKDGYLGITSENASRFSVADILKKVDHNVELIQQKRGKLLEEENRQRLEAIKRAEAEKEEREEEQKTHNSAQAE